MELILALIAARVVVGAAADESALSGRYPAKVGAGSGYQSEGRLPVRSGVRGIGDRAANLMSRFRDWLRRGIERRAVQMRADSAVARPTSRGWMERRGDQWFICSRCGHGGPVPNRADCMCLTCWCAELAMPPDPDPGPQPWRARRPTDLDEPPTRPTDLDDPPTRPVDPFPPAPTPPSGTDGPAAGSDPTAPSPGTAGSEGDDDVSAPTSPQGYVPTPPTTSRAAGGPPVAGAAGGGGVANLGSLPAIDPSDTRLPECRMHLGAYARNMRTMADGLTSREVDAQTAGKYRELADMMDGLVASQNRIYGPVESAIRESSHVAQRDAYRDR